MSDEKKRPSVAEILAAARKASSAGPGSPAPSAASSEPAPNQGADTKPEASPSASATPPAAASSGAKPPAAGAARPNVKDILAAARAAKGGAASAPDATGPSKAPPAAEKPRPAAAAKPGAEKPSGAKPAGAGKDTASILAAARGGTKPGPVSKADAAVKTQPVAAKPAPGATAVPPMPTKPAYAQKKPAGAVGAEATRRGFFHLAMGSFLALGFTSLTLTSLLSTLGLARFMFPNILTEPPSRFKVGFPADFAPGAVSTKFVAQFGVWVVNGEYQGQQMIYALRTVCTHLGCTPNWLEAEQKFKCPCHGSGFYKDGVNFEGPAPRPLERYAIRLADDGQIEIDKSKMFQEEMGQWADAATFVPV